MTSKGRGRGFAGMTPERRREVAASGGRASHAAGGAHRFTSAEAQAAGTKGGIALSADREHMAAIGRKGGAIISQDRERMAAIGRAGGLAVSRVAGHMADIGRMGGHARRREVVEPAPAAVEPAEPDALETLGLADPRITVRRVMDLRDCTRAVALVQLEAARLAGRVRSSDGAYVWVSATARAS